MGTGFRRRGYRFELPAFSIRKLTQRFERLDQHMHASVLPVTGNRNVVPLELTQNLRLPNLLREARRAGRPRRNQLLGIPTRISRKCVTASTPIPVLYETTPMILTI